MFVNLIIVEYHQKEYSFDTDYTLTGKIQEVFVDIDCKVGPAARETSLRQPTIPSWPLLPPSMIYMCWNTVVWGFPAACFANHCPKATT